jgi:hypothetical protein
MISIPAPPAGCPDDAEDSKDIKRNPPTELHLDGHNQQRRNRAADLAREKDHSEGPSAFHLRKPSEDAGRCRRVSAGLPRAEQESDQNQGPNPRDKSREGGESRPPQDDPGEHRARAESICQVTARNLEQRVGNRERARSEAPILSVKVQFILDPRPCHRYADTVQISEHRQSRQQHEHMMPVFQLTTILPGASSRPTASGCSNRQYPARVAAQSRDRGCPRVSVRAPPGHCVPAALRSPWHA